MEKDFKNYLFIDKLSYVTGKKPEECIFCNPKELVLYQTDDIIILLNKYPYNPAHLIIAPKKHLEKFTDLSDIELLKIMKMIQKAMHLIEQMYSPKGFNIGLNQGKAAGASILNHLHFHIVPRYENELGFMDITGKTRMIVEKLEDTLKKLKNKISILEE